MKLIVPYSIKKLDLSDNVFSIHILKSAAKKSLLGLGYNIKHPETELMISKISITTKTASARALYLLQIEKKIAILILVRKKSDKVLGQNLSIKNPKLESILNKYLDLTFKDLKTNNYQEFEI